MKSKTAQFIAQAAPIKDARGSQDGPKIGIAGLIGHKIVQSAQDDFQDSPKTSQDDTQDSPNTAQDDLKSFPKLISTAIKI